MGTAHALKLFGIFTLSFLNPSFQMSAAAAPTCERVVILGGGIHGASTAFHLSKQVGLNHFLHNISSLGCILGSESSYN